MTKTFAEILKEHTAYCNEQMSKAQELTKQAKMSGDIEKSERLISEAEKLLAAVRSASEKFEAEHGDELAALISYVDTEKKRRELQEQTETPIVSSMKEPELYLNAEQQEKRRIVFVNCEDDTCGFVVEFKHPNCTFFFCKEHGTGINIDLSNVSDAGVVCELHGKMERYDVVKDDNVCPRCEKSTLAVLSAGR